MDPSYPKKYQTCPENYVNLSPLSHRVVAKVLWVSHRVRGLMRSCGKLSLGMLSRGFKLKNGDAITDITGVDARRDVINVF